MCTLYEFHSLRLLKKQLVAQKSRIFKAQIFGYEVVVLNGNHVLLPLQLMFAIFILFIK